MPSQNGSKRVFENTIEENLQGNYFAGSQNKEWLNSSEAADFLGISVGSLRNKVSNGTIEVSGKIGRLNRFRVSDLEELLLRKSK
ncbi:MAG: helix-turn-helix domain-containing protein [Cryobacterium sp.]|nr:helix-turn-helix domain-containing protein [Oligoflexia bacterium]